MTMHPALSRLFRFVGVDFHVFATLLLRGWGVLAGALTVLLVPLFLSPTEQGYYYTFASLIGLQIVFELGLAQVVLQTVSHETAHLRIGDTGVLEGDAARLDRLASLIRLLRRWYTIAAMLFAVFACVAGAWFLHRQGELPEASWLGAWIVMVICTAVNLSFIPALAFMEGCGQIGQVARLRLGQSVVGCSGLWLALIGGLGLWAACVVPLVCMLLTSYWLRRSGSFYQDLRRRNFQPSNALNWTRDMLPLQWRIALSALSGYFTFYMMTPMVFAHRGAAEAGQFGIAMTIFNALVTVGTSWVYARTPTMAQHVSRNERTELNAVFRGVLKRSFIFTGTAVAILLLAILVLRAAGIPQALRISSLPVLACLAVVCLANCVIFSAAAYMRAHREEPMLVLSIAGGIATLAIAYTGSQHSVLAMSLGYAVLTSCVLLPWTILILTRYYRRR
jgi:O-antigen/teichoic acid export membrane protein